MSLLTHSAYSLCTYLLLRQGPLSEPPGFLSVSTITPDGRRIHKIPSSGGYQSSSHSWWIALFAWLVLGNLSGMAQSPAPVTFSYNGTDGSDGSAQTYTVPSDVYSLSVVAVGAKGRDGTSGRGGQGGQVEALLTVTPGQVLTITVGGTPQTQSGGYNGGGSGVRLLLLVVAEEEEELRIFV